MASGVYEIRNLVNNRFYIGSSIDVEKRFKHHRRELAANKHRNKHLQNAVNKYGLDKFSFRLLCIFSNQDLLFFEQLFIDRLNPDYNIYKTAGSPLGYKHDTDARKKIAVALVGNTYALGKHMVPHSEETRKKISESRRNSAAAKAQLESLHKARIGKPLSEETKLRISKGRLAYLRSKEVDNEREQ